MCTGDEASSSYAPAALKMDEVISIQAIIGQPSKVGAAPAATSSGTPAAIGNTVAIEAKVPTVGADLQGDSFTTRLCKTCNLCAKNRRMCRMLPTGTCVQCSASGVECKQRLEKKRGRRRVTADNVAQLVQRPKRSRERAQSAKAIGVEQATDVRDWTALGSIPYLDEHYANCTASSSGSVSAAGGASGAMSSQGGSQGGSALTQEREYSYNESVIQEAYMAGIQAATRAPQIFYGSYHLPYCHPAVPALPYQEVRRMAQLLGAGGMPAMYAASLQQATAPQLGYGNATPAVQYAALMINTALGAATAALPPLYPAAAGAAAPTAGTSLAGMQGVTRGELRPTFEVVPGDVHQGATGPVLDMPLFAPLPPLQLFAPLPPLRPLPPLPPLPGAPLPPLPPLPLLLGAPLPPLRGPGTIGASLVISTPSSELQSEIENYM